LGFVMTMTIVLGLVFQLPLVMVFLSRVGLVAPDRYRALRRHAVLANVVLAAVLSPPDLLGMAVFSLPLIVLYEIGLRCAAWSRTC
ncbi:MAG: twin-arginine translocase subunit TatC, partial [Planctomycetaceae bacterium]|nr:twin-arginine translocase subunit TatC [Planctomycetaceae bacterium]